MRADARTPHPALRADLPLKATVFTHFLVRGGAGYDSVISACEGALPMSSSFFHGAFGDSRRAAAGEFLLDRVVETGSLVVRRVGADRAGEMSVHRFLSSPAVGVEEIVATAGARTSVACRGRRIVAA